MNCSSLAHRKEKFRYYTILRESNLTKKFEKTTLVIIVLRVRCCELTKNSYLQKGIKVFDQK